ncbi:MAG: 4-(cytidine 5'-diphospho)-2-C-methyl-D-erythritol kinase [Chloroflexi bacterium]|nr:4-(cytidine 5'-diphospho)-2-C-methyl-D-erythritol kinase [Chloroflexota bacterium]
MIVSESPGRIAISAPAKLNLTLEVVRRRDDGFHELRSVFLALDLADTITVEASPTITLSCSDPDLETPGNLVWRAAEALRREAGLRTGALLTLVKRIPVAAGLGGGSSDAASTLLALNALWNLGYPRTRLQEIGATLGSDIPFFLGTSPLALVTGRGEVLEPLPFPPHLATARFVLVKPPVGISAGAVYRAYPPSRWSDGHDRTASWFRELTTRLSVGEDLVPAPFNDLEAIALQVAPEALVARNLLLEAGVTRPVMAGSGSTFFALVHGDDEASHVAKTVISSRPTPAISVFQASPGELASIEL